MQISAYLFGSVCIGNSTIGPNFSRLESLVRNALLFIIILRHTISVFWHQPPIKHILQTVSRHCYTDNLICRLVSLSVIILTPVFS